MRSLPWEYHSTLHGESQILRIVKRGIPKKSAAKGRNARGWRALARQEKKEQRGKAQTQAKRTQNSVRWRAADDSSFSPLTEKGQFRKKNTPE